MTWETDHGTCMITYKSIDWIMNNVQTSKYNNQRCYVYNRAFARYFDNNDGYDQYNGKTKSGGKFKTQWRWRCTFRDCYQVCRLLWPHVKVKLHKIEQVIDHYTPEYSIDGNVVSMQQYKEAMSLE